MTLTPACCTQNVVHSILRVVLILCTCAPAFAGGWPLQKDRLFIKVYGGACTAGSYYDTDGQLIAELRGSLTEPGDTVQRRFINSEEFEGLLGGVYGEYGLTDDLTLVLDVPVGSFQLLRKVQILEQLPDNATNNYQADTTFTRTSPSYYGIGARYRITSSEKLQTMLSLSLHIPPGFSRPILNNPDHEFLSDGAFEVRGGIELGIPASFGWAAFTALYNWRDEELKDEAHFHAEIGFNKVENAFFKFHVDVLQSLSSFDNVEFTPRYTLLQENYVSAGASFTLFLTPTWFADVDYSVRIIGANTWNLSNVVLGTGLVLDNL